MFFPKCYSPVCIVLSLTNLDSGFETCFYNGMDGYAKVWLQIVFPFYMRVIALALIMGSRYSTRVQRLTAQRGLPVLATLFLFSYTKLLLATCCVNFSILLLSLIFLVNTVNWCALFTNYLVLFLTLLPFNILPECCHGLNSLALLNHYLMLTLALTGTSSFIAVINESSVLWLVSSW